MFAGGCPRARNPRTRGRLSHRGPIVNGVWTKGQFSGGAHIPFSGERFPLCVKARPAPYEAGLEPFLLDYRASHRGGRSGPPI